MEALEALNRVITACLEFAELQAMNRRPMTMAARIAKLDDCLRLSDRGVLTHAGRIGREQALEFSKAEFACDRQRTLAEPSPLERDFEEATRRPKVLESEKRRSGRTRRPTGE